MTQKCNFLWIDLEMTGLNPERDVILEAAVIATDSQLKTVIEGPSLVVHQPDSILENMNDWSQSNHAVSGLTEKVKKSKKTVQEVEQAIIDFIYDFCDKKELYFAGNSIHQDRSFIRMYMPKLHELAHYRMVDVSTVKVLVQQWYPGHKEVDFHKNKTHRALDDIKESIAELQHYKKHFFN